jgi:hypothetical protein
MTRAEFEATCKYLDSDLFKQRMIEYERRLQTEPLTVEEAATILGLSVDVFTVLKGAEVAWEAVKPTLGTEH